MDLACERRGQARPSTSERQPQQTSLSRLKCNRGISASCLQHERYVPTSFMASQRLRLSVSKEPRGLVASVKHLVFAPVRIALSKPAQRVYLTSILATFAGLTLLATAVIGYTLFYWSYVPRIGFERPIYLQFDHVYDHVAIVKDAHPYPYGTVTLLPDLVGAQQYDVTVELTLPRTVENINAGNFMLEAVMYAPQERSVSDEGQSNTRDMNAVSLVLARSRRPAIVSYRSSMVELAHQIFQLHWYLLGFRKEEERVRTVVFENVKFPKGRRNVPSTMSVEVQSTHRLQIYSAKAVFRARFRGLRWLMYNHRVISAAIFIPSFWITELLFAGVAWAVAVVFFMTPPEDEHPQQMRGRKMQSGRKTGSSVKSEEEHERIEEAAGDTIKPEMSDTERTFPTPHGHPPLTYTSPEVKQEDDDGPSAPLMAVPLFSPAVEADDEEDDMDFFADSGMGTSLESSSTTARRDSMRKRKGRITSRERD